MKLVNERFQMRVSVDLDFIWILFATLKHQLASKQSILFITLKQTCATRGWPLLDHLNKLTVWCSNANDRT